MAADVLDLGMHLGSVCWSGYLCVQGSVRGVALPIVTASLKYIQSANEVQLILLRDHILAFFINKLVKKFLKILHVKRVTESEIFIFLK